MLLEFVGQAATFSRCLKLLDIRYTRTKMEIGAAFLQVLADSQINSLENLTINDEPMWFHESD